MDVHVQPHTGISKREVPFDIVALVLQGGGALGSYQAGVYEALSEAGIEPNWIAGVSIGAINAAIIAGNAPEARLERLREFWMRITADGPWPGAGDAAIPFARGHELRQFLNQMSAGLATTLGASGFFGPRPGTPFWYPVGTLEATSFYDTSYLKGTLEKLVDFDLINRGPTRLSVGAVNVRTGNFIYFDTTTHVIRPEHVMASGALPPGFPAVEIEGEHYWDGALISNTPLQWIVNAEPRRDTLAFQVDLWSARGAFPRSMFEVVTREKEIRFSSRTRAGTEHFRHTQKLRRALAELLEKLPGDLRNSPEVQLLEREADRKVYNVVELIYFAKEYEGHSKDYEFSRLTMRDHWLAGYHDAKRTLRHPEALERPQNLEGLTTFDLASHGRE